MTKRTVTDFETVRVEEEQWECDHCEALVDEDDIHTAVYVSGDQLLHDKAVVHSHDATHVESKHLCESCLQLREANQIRETKQYYRSWWRGTRKHLAWLAITIVPFMLGLSTDLLAVHSSATSTVGQYIAGAVGAMVVAAVAGVAFVLLVILLPVAEPDDDNETDNPQCCQTCGLSYRTLAEYNIEMHEEYCPYKDGNGFEQYDRYS